MEINSKMKKGYKATNNMKCQEITYEVGKEYYITSKRMCYNGFHYCENIEDTLDYYNYEVGKTVFIEVEDLDPNPDVSEHKTVSQHIKVLRVVGLDEFPEPYKFDKKGNMLVDGKGWHKTYDEEGRVLESFRMENGVKMMEYSQEYDKFGNITSFKQPSGFNWKATYTEDGKGLTFENNHYSWEKEYDENGNVISYKDSRTLEGGYYDWTKKYDENGNLVFYLTSDAYWIKYSYDGECRLINEENSVGEITETLYDENGNILKTTTNYGYWVFMTYDDKGNVLTSKNSDGYEVVWRYDEEGNITYYASSDGIELEEVYDEKGNVIKHRSITSDGEPVEWEITIK